MSERPKRIFIIEDDEHVSKVYEAKFSREGFEVLSEKTGEEAVSRIATEKPDLIILDLMLPKKDGFVVLEEIKKDPSTASIPVLVLSNLGQPSDKERTLGLGAKEHLIKVENSIEEIADKVKMCLGGSCKNK